MTLPRESRIQVCFDYFINFSFIFRLNMFSARALCGIEWINNYSDQLPDCKVFRAMKSGNFIGSKCLWSSESVCEHIRTHGTKKFQGEDRLMNSKFKF